MSSKNICLSFILGEISFDEISLLENDDLALQVGFLKEDLLQVEYSSDFLLDVGWYPSFDLDGCFQVRVIESGSWDEPLYLAEADSVPLLIKKLTAAQGEIFKISTDLK